MIRFWWLKAIGGPGSLGFFLAATACALALRLFPRTRRLGVWLLMAIPVSYLIFSIPAVAHALAGSAAAVHAEPAATYGRQDEIFVLDGDNYRSRAALTARLAPAMQPRTIWVAGGGELRDALVASGIRSGQWRWADTAARTTYDQMLWIQGSMAGRHVQRAAIVASRLHTPRVTAIAKQLRMNVVVVPSPVDAEPTNSGAKRWLPSLAGLRLSRDGLYERIAVAYYRRNGWM
ncbi:MAG TPA: ElyC/SanA/YdcF family protein [Vicinamibacterales bacterium]|nr:ElyC/SanA/YdcF family protein [Vicinamibacterales bacterium]